MTKACRFILAAFLAGIAMGCEKSEPAISFSGDVKPILDSRCGDCHSPGQPGYEASELSFATYDSLMEGTRYGPVVIPGDGSGSNLIVLVEGRADPSISMPHGDTEPLLQGEIDTIKLWVEQGAKDN